jgi:hypothetical protein
MMQREFVATTPDGHRYTVYFFSREAGFSVKGQSAETVHVLLVGREPGHANECSINVYPHGTPEEIADQLVEAERILAAEYDLHVRRSEFGYRKLSEVTAQALELVGKKREASNG